jgi:signal transduction histidine kinase
MPFTVKALVKNLTPFQLLARRHELEQDLTTSTRAREVKRALEILVRNGLHVLIAGSIVLVSISVAASLKLESSETSIARYVSVWEEEIAKNLLLAGDRELFEKVLTQISDLAPEVVAASEGRESCADRQLTQKVSITLYGTPAGGLTICRSPTRLAVASLQSPAFFIGIILGGLIFLWHTRRTGAERASLATAFAIDGLSKQVAHDLRSPLGALKIVGSRLSLSNDDQALVQVLQSSISRISQITEDLLGQKSKVDSISPLKVVENVVQEMRLSAESKGVLLVISETEATESAPAALLPPQIQPQDLARVVSNLIQNAIEAPSAIEVNIATRERQTDFEIEIADNGSGIPRSSWRRLGSRGFTSGKTSGSGLGISHAKDWTNSVGGRLRVRSSVNRGTSVTLTLPR